MARVQWEMLPSLSGEEPLGVTARVARQLRTTYAPRPDDTRAGRRLKVLVVGDPDDSLEDARKEAQKVNELLKAKLGEDAMEALIGAPEDGTLGSTVDGFLPASYSHVVKDLLRGDYDIVHYCGHAAFDPEDPKRAGWIFKHGRLTAADLEGMKRPPILVVANACLTSQLGQSTQAQGTRGPSQDSRTRPRGGLRLVASLADEFFHRGVSHYIGTAWEVSSGPAKDFATEFYTQLLQKQPVGEAVRLARKRLLNSARSYGKENAMAWAAYQHYGDPNTALEFDVISPNSDARTTTRSLS